MPGPDHFDGLRRLAVFLTGIALLLEDEHPLFAPIFGWSAFELAEPPRDRKIALLTRGYGMSTVLCPR